MKYYKVNYAYAPSLEEVTEWGTDRYIDTYWADDAESAARSATYDISKFDDECQNIILRITEMEYDGYGKWEEAKAPEYFKIEKKLSKIA